MEAAPMPAEPRRSAVVGTPGVRLQPATEPGVHSVLSSAAMHAWHAMSALLLGVLEPVMNFSRLGQSQRVSAGAGNRPCRARPSPVSEMHEMPEVHNRL